MNLFQLVLKNMRQRALSSWLTFLSVVLGAALAIALIIAHRESEKIFGQSDFGYEMIVGPARGSDTQLVLNTVYHIDKSAGNIPYSLYERMTQNPPAGFRREVKTAIPVAVGDSYQGKKGGLLRIVATSPKYFGYEDNGARSAEPFQYRFGKSFEMAEGRVFAPNKFEGVIGADVARLSGLNIGDAFKATHGMPAPNQTPDVHDEVWHVVGILKPTHTAADRCVYIPLITIFTIAEHEAGLEAQAAIKGGADPRKTNSPAPAAPAPTPSPATAEAAHDHDHDHAPATPPAVADAAHDHDDEGPKPYTLNTDGTINITLPKDDWQISAILVKARGPFDASSLQYTVNTLGEASAVNPAETMRTFFGTFLGPASLLLQSIAWLVTVVAGVGILVGIYNSVASRKREIAILRALGATKPKILTIICVEAGLIGVVGGIVGLAVGHALAAAGSAVLERRVGESLNWHLVSSPEAVYLVAVAAIAVLAGLIPALKAYTTPVATNLSAA